MTKTLTTERLRDIASSPSFDANPLSHEVKYMARELLANREAQPVAGGSLECEDELNAALRLHRLKVEGHSQLSDSFRAGFKYARRTAPPAPVVNPEFTGATAVPTFEEWLSTQENKPLGWVRDSMKESYDACRAAMLAQPVSQGCIWIACGEQLPAVGETVLVSSDGYVSVGELERSGANYRYFTSVATGRELTVTHWMPLPAAPEGGK